MRTVYVVVLSGFIISAATILWSPKSQPAQPTVKELLAAPDRVPLPTSQVILFNSGVGYFQREGEISGNTQIDLAFPASDVNDLLKSLILQDTGGGKVASVTYDNQDPVEKTLQSFPVDLTYNPTFGQLLNQARGEKAEVALQATGGSPAGTLTGVIVGLQADPSPVGVNPPVATDRVNLLSSDGMRSIPLNRIERVRFTNPAFQNEFDRALQTLTTAHDTQKKQVRLQFTGDGKRRVRVGYVVENPIWKASYRLALDAAGKAFLQGWALVENVSDEDWKDVRIVLVSSRPISYQIDLYPPLYVPRPVVEPELFAALRPPNYQGPLAPPRIGIDGGQGGAPMGFGGLGGGGLGLAGLGAAQTANLGLQGGMANLGMQGGFAGFGGQLGGFPPNLYQQLPPRAFLKPESQTEDEGQQPGRLTFQELQERRRQKKQEAQKVGSALAALDLKEGIEAVASAEEIGDHFQYILDNKVILPRRKSALLPIVSKDVQISRVSIFNRTVHPKFPLLGMRFKNTTDLYLMQGPVTVYEAGTYAGDARFPDLQPKEERLLAYAVDLGTEVKVEEKADPDRLIAVKIVKGVLELTTKTRETKTYLIRNRSGHDRVLLIEQPVRSDWKLLEKPVERSRDVYRLEVKIPADQFRTQQATEEHDSVRMTSLLNKEDKEIRLLLAGWSLTPAMKKALERAAELRGQVVDADRELTRMQQELNSIGNDQERLRQDLKIVPANSPIHRRYLEKFDKQESQIEKLQENVKKQAELQRKQKKEYEDVIVGLNVE